MLPAFSEPQCLPPARLRARACAALAVMCVVAVSACATTPQRAPHPLAAAVLEEGAFVTGTPVGLDAPVVVNRRDFIYALAFGPDRMLAFTHHVTTHMELSVVGDLGNVGKVGNVGDAPRTPRFRRPLNRAEFDVEDVAVVPSGPRRGALVVPSRQGMVRVLEDMRGDLIHEHDLGVPLVRVAVSTDGAIIAVGAADGRVFLRDAATGDARGEARVHTDEVHGLAFLPDGRLVSAAFDGQLKVSTIARDGLASPSSTAAPSETTSSRDAPATLFVLAVDKTIPLPGPATDVDVSARGVVAVAYSHVRAVRSYEVYTAEKRGEFPPVSPHSGAAIVDLEAGTLPRTFTAHRGFTSTVALSPDARTIVTGGWDNRVVAFDVNSGTPVATRTLAWTVRRVRMSPDGRTLGVAAWTPVNALNSGDSEPSLLLYPVLLEGMRVAH